MGRSATAFVYKLLLDQLFVEPVGWFVVFLFFVVVVVAIWFLSFPYYPPQSVFFAFGLFAHVFI